MGARADVRRLSAELEGLRAEVAGGLTTREQTPQWQPAGQPASPPADAAPRRSPMRSAAHRYGVHARPLISLATLHTTGALAHTAGLGVWALTAGLGAGTLWWYLRGKWRLDRTPERFYALSSWLAASGWLGMAGAAGATTVDTRLWILGAGMSVPWWVHHRVRPQPMAEDDITVVDWAEQIRLEWAQRVACPGGPLPHSRLLELRRLGDDGWDAVIEVHDGNSDAAIAQWKNIGARLRLRIDEIDIEPHPGGLHLARIMVQRQNPLLETRLLLQPTFDPATGRSQIAFYSDSKPVVYRHYRRGSGPIHDLFSGSTRSGKTELVKTLLGEERRSGLIVSYLLDPQRGHSYGLWKKRVHKFAGTMPDIHARLLELRRRMYGRNELMSNIEWKDEKEREYDGVEDFTPGDPRHGLPMISVTIDEFQKVVSDPEYGPACAALVEEMIEMSSKCGIKFRLLTPVPLIDSLGGSQRIKDAVASGNVVVFRTSTPLTGQAVFNGTMPIDPCELPKEWPNGETTAGLGFVFGPGADRPTKMRTVVLHDHYEWATTGTPAELDDVMTPEPATAQQNNQPATPDAGDPAAEFTLHLGAAEDTDDTAEEKLLARDRVLTYFADGQDHMPVEVKTHFHARGIKPRTVGKALTDLTADGLLEHPKERGPYRLSAAGRTELERRSVVA